jgi:glycosyltransferase involved in cell wall biosynthesis
VDRPNQNPTRAGRKRVRVLFCENNTDGTIGGSYYSLLYLSENLDRRRFEPVIVFHRDHILIPRFRKAQLTVHILNRPHPFRIRMLEKCGSRYRPFLAPLRLIQKVGNAVKFVGASMRWARFLRQQHIDLIHLNNSVTKNHDWMIAGLLTGTMCVTHERGINHSFSLLARLFARRLNAVMCISNAVRDCLLQHNVTSRNVHVVPNGLDPGLFVPERPTEDVRAEYGISKDSPVIGIIGNLREWKGQEVVLRALPDILLMFPNLTCMLVGNAGEGDRQYERRLRALVAELAIEKHVIFTGYRQNVADILSSIDVPIHASILPEPFGRVLLEAMAMRKPVVASRDGGVMEIVVDGVTGFTFTPGDSEALADSVIKLLSNPRLRKEFGDAAFLRLTSHFHVSQNVEKTVAIYEALLETKEQFSGSSELRAETLTTKSQ